MLAFGVLLLGIVAIGPPAAGDDACTIVGTAADDVLYGTAYGGSGLDTGSPDQGDELHGMEEVYFGNGCAL